MQIWKIPLLYRIISHIHVNLWKFDFITISEIVASEMPDNITT